MPDLAIGALADVGLEALILRGRRHGVERLEGNGQKRAHPVSTLGALARFEDPWRKWLPDAWVSVSSGAGLGSGGGSPEWLTCRPAGLLGVWPGPCPASPALPKLAGLAARRGTPGWGDFKDAGDATSTTHGGVAHESIACMPRSRLCPGLSVCVFVSRSLTIPGFLRVAVSLSLSVAECPLGVSLSPVSLHFSLRSRPRVSALLSERVFLC